MLKRQPARRIAMIRGGEKILVSTKRRKRKRSDRDRVEAAGKDKNKKNADDQGREV